MKRCAAFLAFAIMLSNAAVAANASADTGTAVDTYLTRLVPLGFSGNVIVADRGKIVLEKGYGLSDREHGVPVTSNTAMTVGSITKQFTAAAILTLEMQGKLRTSDSIAQYLANVPLDKASITLHELLTHTSGLASDYGPGDFEPVDREAYVARVMRAPLEGTPGGNFHYSNAGYNLLAAIIERVSGASYDRYLHDNLFAPAGMRQTGDRIPQWSPSQIAVGYRDGERWGTMLEHWGAGGPYWNQIGSGGIESTPGDMFRWHVALQQNRVLSAEERKKFETGYVQSGPNERYAYGWGVRSSPYGLLVTHNGGNTIFAADFLRFIDRDTVIYIASNESEMPATLISRGIARLAFQAPFDVPPATVNLSKAQLDALAGTYCTQNRQRVDVRADRTELIFQTADPALFSALGPPLPPQIESDVRTRTSAFIANAGPTDSGEHPNWQAAVETNGKLKSATYVGATVEGEDPASWILARFERGDKYVQLAWGPEQLIGIGVAIDPPSFRYHAQSATQFFAYDARSGSAMVSFSGTTLSLGHLIAKKAKIGSAICQ